MLSVHAVSVGQGSALSLLGETTHILKQDFSFPVCWYREDEIQPAMLFLLCKKSITEVPQQPAAIVDLSCSLTLLWESLSVRY